MAAQPAELPVIFPTVPGCPNGIISREPRILQCQECGVTADAASVGLPESGRRNPALVHILSDLHFHTHPWPDGRTDNFRLCRACRLARGCECWNCRDERRDAR
jgi:hypothetical protein